MLITKEVIRPGTYYYTDNSGKPQKLVVSNDFIKHLKTQGNEMLRLDLSIPVPLEHQNVGALTKAEQAAANLKNNAGWVKGYTILPGHRLFSIVDIPDDDFAKKLSKTVRWVSPHINSFTDGNGKRWEGVISHLALTSRPRIVAQEPFPSVAAAMSMLPKLEPIDGLMHKLTFDASVSLSGTVIEKDGAWTPGAVKAFSRWAGVKLADDIPPEKGKKEKPKDKPGAGNNSTTDIEELDLDDPLAMPGDQGAVIDEAGNIQIYDVLSDLLPVAGLNIAESNADNFLENLYKAVMDMAKEKGMNQMEEQKKLDTTPNAGANNNPIVQEQQPLYMSLEEISKIADPALKAVATRAAAVEKRALTEFGKRRQERIGNLARRLQTQKAKDALLALTNVKLSLSPEGDVIDPSEAALSLLEENVVDVPAALRQTVSQNGGAQFGSYAKEQPHPEWGDGLSAERATAVVEEFCRNTGLQQPK